MEYPRMESEVLGLLLHGGLECFFVLVTLDDEISDIFP